MSLKIWLPLNGSFEEKVQHKTLEEPNACTLPSTTTSGKIGTGYCFGDREGIKIPYISIPSTVSYALWVRLDSDCVRHILDCRLGN